jgi:hypothetical protein
MVNVRREIELTPNAAAKMPWSSHVKRLIDFDDSIVRQFVERDREHWQIAESDPRRAWHRAFEEKLFFRSGPPRLGEPLYRDKLEAEKGWTRTPMGRGTGHLGTGLYFFGTLRAALHGHEENLGSVWVVDLSSLTDGEILTPGRDMTHDLHDMGRALGGWSSDKAYAVEGAELRLSLAEQIARLQEELRNADGEEWEALYEQQYELREQLKEARGVYDRAESALKRAYNRIRQGSIREYPDWDFAERGTLDFDDAVPAEVTAATRDLKYVEAAKLPPTAAYAVERYEDDVARHTFPGYRPLTYYMRRKRIAAVVHRDWREFNSGDIGNIWYPEVT